MGLGASRAKRPVAVSAPASGRPLTDASVPTPPPPPPPPPPHVEQLRAMCLAMGGPRFPRSVLREGQASDAIETFLPLLEQYLAGGGDINATCSFKDLFGSDIGLEQWTLLHAAVSVWVNAPRCAAALLERGANPAQPDSSGRSALNEAFSTARHMELKPLELLLARCSFTAEAVEDAERADATEAMILHLCIALRKANRERERLARAAAKAAKEGGKESKNKGSKGKNKGDSKGNKGITNTSNNNSNNNSNTNLTPAGRSDSLGNDFAASATSAAAAADSAEGQQQQQHKKEAEDPFSVRSEFAAALGKGCELHKKLYSPAILAKHFGIMTTVPFDVFREFKRIPRSSDGLARSTEDLPSSAKVLFISHRWLHATAGHPDDNNNSKHQHICQAVQSWCKETNTSEHDVHLWVDFACVDQDSVQSMHRSIQSLPFFILLCDAFICIFHDEYESRAWCRLEMLFGFSLRVKLSSFKCYQWRQHKLNAFGFEHDPVTNLPDPAQGRVHSQIDLEYIKALTWFAWKLHTWV